MEEDAPVQDAPVQQSRAAFVTRFYIQFDHYKRLLFRYCWIPLLTVGIAGGAQWYFVKDALPKFASVGRMIVNVRLFLPNAQLYSEEANNFLGTQEVLMKGESIASNVKARLQKEKPELHPAPVEIEVGLVPKASIFNLQAVGGDPAYTQVYLEATMEEYINLKKDLFSHAAASTQVMMEEKLREAGAELEKSKEDVIRYQSTNDFVIMEPTGGNRALDFLTGVQRTLAQHKSDLESLSITNTLELDPDYRKANQTLRNLEFSRDELTNSIRVADLIALADFKKQIVEQEERVKDAAKEFQDRLTSEKLELEQKIQHDEGQVKEWEAKAVDENKKMAAFELLKENQKRLQTRYDQMEGELQRLVEEKGIGQETVTILDAATPAVVVPPDKIKRTVMMALIGLFLGMGIVVFIDRLDDRPSCFTELVELFDVPVLGQFPLLKPKSRKIGVPILQLDDDRYPLIEANRSLRSALLYQDPHKDQPKSIVITSASPNDGKSMVSANLAVTLAQTGARVLLIDADVRRGVLHTHFSVASSPGLAEVLAGQCPWSTAVVNTAIPNLYLLPRGSSPRHSVNLFATAGKVLTEIAGHFDYYLFDTAPVMVGDDVLSLAPHVDGLVMVVRAGFTSGRIVQTALDSLQLRRVKVLGLVFNAVRPNASDYYYYRFRDYYPQHPVAKKNGD